MRSGIPTWYCDECGGRINPGEIHWIHADGKSKKFCDSCWRRVQ